MPNNHTTLNNKIIYDFGANNGDDIAYYLKKADIVVAVEANPTLTKYIEERFSSEIFQGKLFIENCVITADEIDAFVPFYIHKYGHVISQFPKPKESELQNFDEVMLPSKSVMSIISKYGYPHYVKIDIEGYDQEILRTLFNNKIFPEFISAESHSIEVFSLLVSSNQYSAFNLVEGPLVPILYGDTLIHTAKDKERHSFPSHSAGPFGDDIKTEWMTFENLFKRLAFEGLGWKDIHAAKNIPPNPSLNISFPNYAKAYVLKKLTPKFIRPIFISLGLFK